jgi:hypothetical protein
MPDLKSKTLTDLRKLAGENSIIGRFQMGKEELIMAIETSISDAKAKPAAQAIPATPPKTDPIALLVEVLKVNKNELKTARKRFYNETTEDGIESAKNCVKAAENKCRLTKVELKKARKAEREDEPFSWGALIGVGALVLTAAGVGAGAAMLLDNGSEADAGGNGDSL